jgi:hypothetical protein
MTQRSSRSHTCGWFKHWKVSKPGRQKSDAGKKGYQQARGVVLVPMPASLQ